MQKNGLDGSFIHVYLRGKEIYSVWISAIASSYEWKRYFPRSARLTQFDSIRLGPYLDVDNIEFQFNYTSYIHSSLTPILAPIKVISEMEKIMDHTIALQAKIAITTPLKGISLNFLIL